MANGFEDLAASMGIDLSAPSTVFETPTEDATEAPTTEETTEQADEAVEESNVLNNDETITDSTDVEEKST